MTYTSSHDLLIHIHLNVPKCQNVPPHLEHPCLWVVDIIGVQAGLHDTSVSDLFWYHVCVMCHVSERENVHTNISSLFIDFVYSQ